jgi:hypothetical protein
VVQLHPPQPILLISCRNRQTFHCSYVDKILRLHCIYRLLNHCSCFVGRIHVALGVVEAVNGNIKALLRRGRGYRDMNYLLLKAQRLAATKTEFVAFQKAA